MVTVCAGPLAPIPWCPKDKLVALKTGMAVVLTPMPFRLTICGGALSNVNTADPEELPGFAGVNEKEKLALPPEARVTGTVPLVSWKLAPFTVRPVILAVAVPRL